MSVFILSGFQRFHAVVSDHPIPLSLFCGHLIPESWYTYKYLLYLHARYHNLPTHQHWHFIWCGEDNNGKIERHARTEGADTSDARWGSIGVLYLFLANHCISDWRGKHLNHCIYPRNRGRDYPISFVLQDYCAFHTSAMGLSLPRRATTRVQGTYCTSFWPTIVFLTDRAGTSTITIEELSTQWCGWNPINALGHHPLCSSGLGFIFSSTTTFGVG